MAAFDAAFFRRIARAMIDGAIEDLELVRRVPSWRARKDAALARRWIDHSTNETCALPFATCCRLIGVDPEAMRAEIADRLEAA